MVNYVGRKIRANLLNGYFYIGECLEHTEKKIKILDKESKEVILDLNYIAVLEVLD